MKKLLQIIFLTDTINTAINVGRWIYRVWTCNLDERQQWLWARFVYGEINGYVELLDGVEIHPRHSREAASPVSPAGREDTR